MDVEGGNGWVRDLPALLDRWMLKVGMVGFRHLPALLDRWTLKVGMVGFRDLPALLDRWTLGEGYVLGIPPNHTQASLVMCICYVTIKHVKRKKVNKFLHEQVCYM